MVICQKCGRSYADFSFNYCLDCGEPLMDQGSVPTLPIAPAQIAQQPKLSDDCLKILQLLNRIPEVQDGPTSEEITGALNMDGGKAKYCLDLLVEKQFISYIVDMDYGCQYNIVALGRKYIYENEASH